MTKIIIILLMATNLNYSLKLHKKQRYAMDTTATEVLYGGQAGPGKSHFLRAAAITFCLNVPGLECLLTRRIKRDLELNHIVNPTGLPHMLEPLIRAGVVKYNKTDLQFTFPNKSYIKCMGLDREADIEDQVKGIEIGMLLNDESSLLTPRQHQYLKTRLRVPKKLNNYVIKHFPQWTYTDTFGKLQSCFPRIFNASNPLGPSHAHHKRHFIDGSDPFDIVQTYANYKGELLPSFRKQFIPGVLTDNPSLDPIQYRANLAASGISPEHLEALLEGNWSVSLSGMFSDVFRRERHIIEVENQPWTPPQWWKKWVAMDWGSTEPYCVLWLCESNGEDDCRGIVYPRGTIICYFEDYGIFHDLNGDWVPNKGLKISPREVGEGIADIEKHYNIKSAHEPWRFAGQDFWNYQKIGDGGYTRAWEMREYSGINFTKAKQGPKSVSMGWERLRSMMRHPGEFPMILITSNCKHLIRTIEDLQRDIKYPDEIMPGQEDHAPDALRYGLSPLYPGVELPSPESLRKEQEERLKPPTDYGYSDPFGFRDKKKTHC